MIELQGVSFSYQNKENYGIKDINLKIKKGECVVFCGRSGCGKTTITRLINGLIPNFYQGNLRGTVKINNKDISEIPMYKIAEKVGSVFQNPRTQFFNVDTDSEIAFGMENLSYSHEILKQAVGKTVKDLKIEKLMGRSIFELSGGEKQKIAFASIYAMSPEIYILDEPASNLDSHATMELRKYLLMLKKLGKTIIIAEHSFYYIKDVVDKAFYMEQGVIKKIYTQKQFINIPMNERCKMGIRALDLASVKPCVKNKKKNININQNLIELKNINIYHKNFTILKDISLTATCGEIIGIIGHNGAGKTTFLRSLCGLHKQTKGEFLWNGKKIKEKQRLRLSYMVMQDVNYQLFADSVENECILGMKKTNIDVVNKVMKELGLYKYKDRHPNTLSGGQKQRTAVATSMICNKEILVFDEPTSGLDFDSMIKVVNLLKKLTSKGKIIFVVTHDYEFISYACNRIIHFDNGIKEEDYKLNNNNFNKLKQFFTGK